MRVTRYRCCALLALMFVLPLAPKARAQSVSCFGSSVDGIGAASTNRSDHATWAQSQSLARLRKNLNWKMAALFQCPSSTDDQLFDLFADISLIVARYVPTATCFKGDVGVVSSERWSHRNWARAKGRDAALAGLKWKVLLAIGCLDRSKQVSYYADVSTVLAGGGPTVGVDQVAASPKPPEPVPAPKPEPPKPTTADVVVATLPGAQVYVDDVFRGTTSPEGTVVAAAVPAGTHRLRVELLDYNTVVKPVEVKAGEPLRLPVDLQKKASAALSESDLVALLDGGVTAKRVAQIVAERGVKFSLTDAIENSLRAAGADDPLLLVIAKSKR